MITSCDQIQRALLEAARFKAKPQTGERQHIATCARCRQVEHEIKTMFDVPELVGSLELPAEIENRVLQNLRMNNWGKARPSTSWNVAWLAFPSVTLVVVIILSYFGLWTATDDVAPVAIIARQIGRVQVNGRNIDAVDMVVAPGDTIITTVTSRADLALRKDHVVAMGGTTFQVIRVDKQNTRVQLQRGGLLNNVQPGANSPRFFVSMPRAEVIVVGTMFYSHSDAECDSIGVIRGSIQVTARTGETRSLGAGEWVEVCESLMKNGRLGTADMAVVEGLIESDRTDFVPTLLAQPPEGSVEPLEKRVKAKIHPSKQRRASSDEGAALPTVDAMASNGDCEGAESRARKVPSSIRAESLVQVAECYLASRQDVAAIHLFREIIRDFPASPMAGGVAYEIARLLREKGDLDAAKRAFEFHLERYPRSPLAAESRFWLCTTAIREGSAPTALQCLRRYRKDYQHGKRTHDTLFLEATLLRTAMSDYRSAMDAYSRYLKTPGTYTEQAQSWMEWCRERIDSER